MTRLAGPHDTEVHVTYTGTLETLPRKVIEDATQLVRESLSNSLRHSQADRVTIEIHGGDDRLALLISDNGIGFDPAAVAWGLGLTNLRERATRAGGQISINSEAETGPPCGPRCRSEWSARDSFVTTALEPLDFGVQQARANGDSWT